MIHGTARALSAFPSPQPMHNQLPQRFRAKGRWMQNYFSQQPCHEESMVHCIQRYTAVIGSMPSGDPRSGMGHSSASPNVQEQDIGLLLLGVFCLCPICVGNLSLPYLQPFPNSTVGLVYEGPSELDVPLHLVLLLLYDLQPCLFCFVVNELKSVTTTYSQEHVHVRPSSQWHPHNGVVK